MTEQEIFDKVSTHLLTQKARSESIYETCLYRGRNGLKCAIGALISDDDYTSEMDDEINPIDVGGLLENPKFEYIPSIKSLSSVNLELLNRLQYIHDFDGISDWKYLLGLVANGFNLNTDILNQF